MRGRVLDIETKTEQFIKRSTEKIDHLEGRIAGMKEAEQLEEFTLAEVKRSSVALNDMLTQGVEAVNKRVDEILETHLRKQDLIGDGPNCAYPTIVDYSVHHQ